MKLEMESLAWCESMKGLKRKREVKEKEGYSNEESFLGFEVPRRGAILVPK